MRTILFCALLALPAVSRAIDLTNLPVPPLNVAAEGMGNAVVADGTLFNATSYNPALLANCPYGIVIQPLGLNISNDILSIAGYLENTNNINNLQNSFSNLNSSMQDITQGLDQSTPNVAQVNQGLAGVNNAIANIQSAAASLTNRSIQMGAGVNVAVKFDDHWGFEVYNNSQGVVQIKRGSLVNSLEGLSSLPNLAGTSPTDVYNMANSFTQNMSGLLKGAFPDQEAQLQSAVSTLQSNETSQGVTQFANTVSNILSSINQSQLQQELLSNVLDVTGLVLVDTVAMATYSVSPMEEIPLTVGVNIKMVNRRIAAADSYSLSAQNLSDFTNVTNYVKNDIDQSTTRWGADLGFLYDFEEYNLSVGLSAQDLVHSTGGYLNTQKPDPLYQVNIDPAPTVVDFGASWHPIHFLSINADMDDLLSDTSTYQGLSFLSHFDLGVGYNILGFLQVRGGFTNNNLSAGVGIPFLGLNYAYAVDNLTQSYDHYLQFQLIL